MNYSDAIMFISHTKVGNHIVYTGLFLNLYFHY